MTMQSRKVTIVSKKTKISSKTLDTYKELSIKNSERQLRGKESRHQLVNITSTQAVEEFLEKSEQ